LRTCNFYDPAEESYLSGVQVNGEYVVLSIAVVRAFISCWDLGVRPTHSLLPLHHAAMQWCSCGRAFSLLKSSCVRIRHSPTSTSAFAGTSVCTHTRAQLCFHRTIATSPHRAIACGTGETFALTPLSNHSTDDRAVDTHAHAHALVKHTQAFFPPITPQKNHLAVDSLAVDYLSRLSLQIHGQHNVRTSDTLDAAPGRWAVERMVDRGHHDRECRCSCARRMRVVERRMQEEKRPTHGWVWGCR
jgi:hypothetical protein